MPRGTLVAIEGIDGAGKRTQLERLTAALTARGVAQARISFPRYESFFGQMVARFLNGEFGALDAVDAHLSAVLFASDRWEAKAELETALGAGQLLLADRYIGSNLAHQTARVVPEKRDAFLAWLKTLEYEVFELPREDLVVYLRLPATEAQRLVDRKSARGYTARQRDLQEADLAHLEAAAAIYDQLAQEPNWARVECFDAAKSALRSPEEIHRDVLTAIEARVLQAAAKGKT